MYLQKQKSKKKKSPKSFFFIFLTFRLFGEKISYFEQINLSYNDTRDNI